MEAKSPEIDRLLASVVAKFRLNAFPLEVSQPESLAHVVLTSAKDRLISASILALPEQPDHYSVIVELDEPPEPQLIPFEIAADGEFDLAEVVELLGRYLNWSHA